MPSFVFNTKNQITTASGVVYDTDGNLTNDGNGNTFSYDPEGKLTSSVVGGVSSTYKNDPLGHRAESVTSAGTFDYVYDPSGRLITEADTTCNSGAPYYPCTDFVYIGASSIPFSQFSDWVCCAAYATFNYYDFAGSLRETTSYAGLSAPYQNDPFGDSSSTQPGWFGFAQLLTMGSGLQLSSTRGYHQVEARWLTPDPSGMGAVDQTNPQSWNQYAYVLNNPLSFVDPMGLDCVYLNDDDSVDHINTVASNGSGDCESATDSGFYFDGAVNKDSVGVDINGDVLAQVNGTDVRCAGDCPGTFVTVDGKTEPSVDVLLSPLTPLSALQAQPAKPVMATISAYHRPIPTINAVHGPSRGDCVIDAINANNGLGLPTASPPSSTDSISNGIVFQPNTQVGVRTMNPGAPNIAVLGPLAAPGFSVRNSYDNCRKEE